MARARPLGRWLAVILALTLAPSIVHAQAAPAPAPPPSPAPAPRRPLVWLGATLFVLPYIASVIGATTGFVHADDMTSARGVLWVPAVGPFLMIGKGSTGGQDALLVLDGLAQVGGLSLFVYGMTIPRGHADEPAKSVEVSIAPLLAPGASGAMLIGEF